MVTSTDSITGNLSTGIATTVRSASRAMLSCGLMGDFFARIAHDQFAPRGGHTFHHAFGNLQFFRRERGALLVARHNSLQFARRLGQQQYTALGAGHLNRRVHHGGEDVLERKARSQGPRYVQQHAQVMKLACAGLRGAGASTRSTNSAMVVHPRRNR